MRTKDINNLNHMLNSFAPNESFIDYKKLLGFLQHRIDVYKKEQEEIQNDTLYYVLQDKEVLKKVEENERIIEEYEWLLEFLQTNYHLLTYNE